MIPYGDGSWLVIVPHTIEYLWHNDNIVPRPGKSVIRDMAESWVIEQLSWLADDWRSHDCRIYSKRMNQGESVKMANSKTVWVRNNLSDSELEELDKNYPTLETIEHMLGEAIENNAKATITWDRKAECYVAYINQGDYACSGRSGASLDALVIGLYKLVLCDFDLASAAKPNKSGYTRG